MSRWVVPKSSGLKALAVTAQPPSDITERIAKYIPGEVVAVFTLLFSALAAMKLDGDMPRYAALALIGLFLAVTVAYVALRAPAGPVRNAHLVVSSLAFLAWAYPISSGLLGTWFIGLVSFFGQAIVLALSIFIAPVTPPPVAVAPPAPPSPPPPPPPGP
jgi:hypothetical protein